jgi:hypothetical protein
MDQSEIRSAIDRPRSERRRIRLGNVERLHPRDDGEATHGARAPGWSSRVGPLGTVAIGAVIGWLAATIFGNRGR